MAEPTIDEWLDPVFRGQRPASEPNANYHAHFGIAQHPNMFARMAGGPSIAQLMANRVTPHGSISDPARAARAEALRRLEQVKETQARLARQAAMSPWALRAEFGPRGALYTMQDVLRNTLRKSKALTSEKAQALAVETAKKDSAQRAKLAAEHRRIAGSLSGGSPTADLLGIIGTNVVLDIHERRQERDRRQRILAVGRRGGLATRPLSTTGLARTNRTGAGATRTLQPVAFPASRSRLPAAVSAASLGSSGGNSLATESAAAVAQAAATATPPTTASATRTTTTKPTPLLTTVRTMFTRTFPRTAPATRPRPITRATPQRQSLLNRLTNTIFPMTREAVGSQVADSKCDCPKPEKRKQSRDRCTNPIISRSVKDGIQTIKRKLQCPPSKPK